MRDVEKIVIGKRTIIVIDYRDLTEAEMIELVNKSGEIIKMENIPQLLLTCFNDRSYATPNFMRVAEKVTAENLHLIEKSALVGLSETKKILLKGYNLLFRRSFRAFDTRDEAIQYLLSENTSDKEPMEVFK